LGRKSFRAAFSSSILAEMCLSAAFRAGGCFLAAVSNQ